MIGDISGKSFDGMDDSWSYHDHLWQGERIHFAGSGPSCSRMMSDAVSEAFDAAHPRHGGDQKRQEAYRAWHEASQETTRPSTTLALFQLYQPTKVAA